MAIQLRLSVLLALCSMVLVVRCNESILQIVLKHPVNVVSDEFVSFAADPEDVLGLPDRTMKRLSSLVTNFRPAYLKISDSNSNRDMSLTDRTLDVNSDLLGPLINWLKSLGLKSVITLPYSTPSNWTPRDTIRVLGAANAAGATDCIWQLGAELNTSDPISYVDDLATLRHISDSIGGPNWSVIGSDISPKNNPDEARFYVELSQHIVESTGWTRALDEPTTMDRGPLMQEPAELALHFSNRPLWLNMPARSLSSTSGDTTTQGLNWAVTLGTSAQQGFSVVFQRIVERDFFSPKLASFVSLLHKQLMGNQVFETRMIPYAGRKDSKQMFAHCTRNVSGAITVMGVNLGAYKELVSTKMPIKSTGTTVLQYILETDRKGNVLCNGEPVQLNSPVRPVTRSKKPSRPTSFLLPSRSVAFWVFPEANVKDCLNKPDLKLEPRPLELRSRTSSEKLLEQLILESLENDKQKQTPREKRHLVVKKDIQLQEEASNREKRSIFPIDMKSQFRLAKQKNAMSELVARNKRQLSPNMNRLFDRFELRKHKKFQLPSLFHKGALTIPPVVSNTHDVYKVDPIENVFKSSENHNLPKGDIFLEVGDNNEQDYVEFEEPIQANEPQKQNFNNFEDSGVDDRGLFNPIDHLFEVFPNDGSKSIFQQADGAGSWEEGSYSAPIVGGHEYGGRDDLDRGVIVKAVEPTWEENQRHLQRAKHELENMYIEDGAASRSSEYRSLPSLGFNELDSAETFFTT